MVNDTSTHKLKVGELAKIAGVSASTVSKVINGRPGISDETRRQVEQILKDHGYSRPLVNTKLSPTIELVVEYIEHNGTMELIKYASYWAQQAGLAITVTQTNHSDATEDCFRGIIERNPPGVIMQQMGGLTTQAKSLLKSRSIPVVIIDPIDTVDSDVMSVSIDNWTAGYQAGKHLLSLGHRRIGHVRGHAAHGASAWRLAGYREGLRRAGLRYDAKLVVDGEFSYESGYAATNALLDLEDRPTAIFAANDDMAAGAICAICERGLSVPGDISVCGFDDTPIAHQIYPALTTVRQPTREMGRLAASELLKEVRELGSGGIVDVPYALQLRRSTGPASAAD